MQLTRITNTHHQRGFSHIAILSALLIIIGIGAIGYRVMNASNAASIVPSVINANGKCLDNYRGNLINANRIELYDCNSRQSSQQWVYKNSAFQISGYCLDVPNASKTPRTNVRLWKCNGTVAQTWIKQANGSLLNPNSNLCLDNKGASTTNGNIIWTYACNGSAAQKWTIVIGATTNNPTPPTPPAPTPVPAPAPTPAPTPTPTPPANGSPSGQAMPVGDISGWRQIFTDDFTASAPLGSFLNTYGSKWKSYDGCCDTARIGTWSSTKTLSASGGMMDQWLHTEGGTPYSSAALPKFSQLYGRYAVRFKSDAIPGFAAAWLLWPDSESWPADGEIDFPEGSLDSSIAGFAHYANAAGGQDYFAANVNWASGWHTAVTEWTPGKIQFYMDGNLIGTSTKQVPSKPMHWVLQSETAYGKRPAAAASGHIKIDWVAAYARN